MIKRRGGCLAALLCAAVSWTSVSVAAAPPAEEGGGSLAAKAQNPIADLISLPIQPNFNFGLGPHDRTQSLVNVQPVIPIGLGDDFTLVTRVIMPLINQPDLTRSDGATFGLGDLNPTFFLVPKLPGNLMVGFGPTVLLPTATDRVLGNGKWGVGPSAVVVWSPAPWVMGALVNNIWSIGGDSQRKNVDRMTLQPFLNYNLADGWFLTTGPIITADWTARSRDRWTVPVGGGFGKLWRLGDQPVNTLVQAYYNVVKPQTVNGPDWQLRFQWTFLFPK